jgi:hypothetical protein
MNIRSVTPSQLTQYTLHQEENVLGDVVPVRQPLSPESGDSPRT